MSFIGHPLVGEQKYISKEINKKTNFKSQALIAYRLVFNFTTDAKSLNYLKGKEVKINTKLL
ncbi:MAG: hypothetical protein MJ219_03290 [Mycoplasmoidaceae bacterium]|nr:hypothetical protein [Mycoplasmoidaceae bacterium]